MLLKNELEILNKLKEVKKMGFGRWLNSRVKNLHWTDISLTKISVAGFILMIAKLWEPILGLDWYWYAAIFVLAVIKPMYKVCKK